MHDGLKNQHTDQFTLGVEREIAPNFSVSGTYIYKHATDLVREHPDQRGDRAGVGVRKDTVPTSNGQTVNLYSVVHQDYDGNGVVDGADIAFVDNNERVQSSEPPLFRRHRAQARLPRGPGHLQEAVRPMADPGVGPVLELDRHRPPLVPTGLQRRGPDVLRRQLDGEPQLRGEQPRGAAPVHTHMGSQGFRVLLDSRGRSRRGRTAPVHDRSTRLGAGELSAAHAVRRSARRRDTSPPDCRRSCPSIPTTPTTSPTWLSSICMPRRFSGWVSSSRSTSSSTRSTSSTPTRPPTWASSAKGMAT